jgi:hypothetical protein
LEVEKLKLSISNLNLKFGILKINLKKGTSAVSPLYAALTARLMQTSGVSTIQSKFQNGAYYTSFGYNDITSGSNDCYSIGPGWDPVTGLGSYSASKTNNWGTYANTNFTKICKSPRLQSNLVLINIVLGLLGFLTETEFLTRIK